MSESVETILAAALRGGLDADFEALAHSCADDVEFRSAITATAVGPAAVTAELRRLQVSGRFVKAVEWEVEASEREAQVIARLPIESFYDRFEWDLALNDAGKIVRITQTGVAQTQPLPPSRIHLTDDFVKALDWARESRNPVIVAYVDASVQPRQSPRGTLQVLSPTQLAFWNHSPRGGLIDAIALNPKLSVHYWGGIGTLYGGAVSFQGTATITQDPSLRTLIYERSPASEQRSDPQRLGCAVVIELTQVSGFMSGLRYNMVG